MASVVTLTLTLPEAASNDVKEALRYNSAALPEVQGRLISEFIESLPSGHRVGTIDVQVDTGTAATGTVTFNLAGSAGDIVTVNGTTFTAVASGATGNQWNVGATATLSAAAFAAAVNASATALVSEHVTASANSGVVTLTSKRKNSSGNAVTLAQTGGGSAAVQALGRYVVSGVVADGETWTITIGAHTEVFTFRDSASLANDISLVGDGVQNAATVIATRFTSAEIVPTKENATTVLLTAGSSYVGTAGNGSLRLQETCPNIVATNVDGSGYAQNGVDATIRLTVSGARLTGGATPTAYELDYGI